MTDTTNLFRRSAIGALWLGGGQVISQVIHLVIRLILARLLAPEDFGLMAMAMLVINFTYWFLDLGFGAALVQQKELTEAHRSTAFWTNMLSGWLVFIILTSTAPFLARFLQAEQLTPVVIALSFGIVLMMPQASLENLLMRDIKFQSIATRKLWSTLLSGATGILMAIAGFSVWALVAETLLNHLLGTLFLFWVSAWRPKLLFDRRAFSELWSYSYPLIGARLFTFLNRNLDTLLIGRFLGAAALGYYNLGYQFVLMPLLYVTRPLTSVLFTALSKVQDDEERIRYGYLQSLSVIAFLTFPLMTLVAIAAPPLIPILLGEKWQPAITLIPFFCLVGLIQAIQNLMPAVFQATGQTYLVQRWTLITVIVNTIAFSVGIFGGIKGVTIAYTSGALLTAPFLQNLILKLLKLDWNAFRKVMQKPAILSLVVIIVWNLSGLIISYTNWDVISLIKALIQATMAMSTYLIFSWYWNPFVRKIWKEQRF